MKTIWMAAYIMFASLSIPLGLFAIWSIGSCFQQGYWFLGITGIPVWSLFAAVYCKFIVYCVEQS